MAWTTPSTYTAGAILTAASLNTNVRDNTNALYTTVQRLGFQQRTTNSVSSTTSFAAASDLFTTSISFTADGTSAYRIVFYSSAGDTGAATRDLFVSLSVSGTETGRLNMYDAGARVLAPCVYQRFLTPTAGVKTINFRHYQAGGATTLIGDAGTGSLATPMYMAVYGPDLA